MTRRRKYEVKETDVVNGRRWGDLMTKILGASLTIIFALSTVIWGIAWTSITGIGNRVTALEVGKSATDVKLDAIANDVKDIKTKVDRMRNP